LGRFQAKKPTLLTACVPKHWVLAVKLERQEEEIITFAADVKVGDVLIRAPTYPR
jgi:hypothetical protein